MPTPDLAVEIDNNLVENAIRLTTIGKKNWLFIGDADAGEHSAIIYTLIESYLLGVSPTIIMHISNPQSGIAPIVYRHRVVLNCLYANNNC
jgi:hypothetical protein